ATLRLSGHHGPASRSPFPYTTLFRSRGSPRRRSCHRRSRPPAMPSAGSTRPSPKTPAAPRNPPLTRGFLLRQPPLSWSSTRAARSEEHTSELQSREKLVCRLLLEKKK